MEVIEWLRTPMRFFISRSDYFTVFVLYITWAVTEEVPLWTFNCLRALPHHNLIH
jgi:hypothetical protein